MLAICCRFISDHTIEDISIGRQATLASYGIETAKDVEYNRVSAVAGIGPHMTNTLCAWRSELLRGFTPDRARGIPRDERQALPMKYAQVHQQLEFRQRRGPRELRDVHTRLQAELARLPSQIDAARIAVAQAEADLAEQAVFSSGRYRLSTTLRSDTRPSARAITRSEIFASRHEPTRAYNRRAISLLQAQYRGRSNFQDLEAGSSPDDYSFRSSWIRPEQRAPSTC